LNWQRSVARAINPIDNQNSPTWQGLRPRFSKPFAISKRERDAIAEGVEEIVLAVALLVPDPEAFDLVEQMVS
jgi:hypothetical protein